MVDVIGRGDSGASDTGGTAVVLTPEEGGDRERGMPQYPQKLIPVGADRPQEGQSSGSADPQ